MKKLSKTQQAVIDHLKEKNAHLLFMREWGSGRSYYFYHDTMEHVRCTTIHKLVDAGLIRINHIGWNETTAHLIVKEESNG